MRIRLPFFIAAGYVPTAANSIFALPTAQLVEELLGRVVSASYMYAEDG